MSGSCSGGIGLVFRAISLAEYALRASELKALNWFQAPNVYLIRDPAEMELWI